MSSESDKPINRTTRTGGPGIHHLEAVRLLLGSLTPEQRAGLLAELLPAREPAEPGRIDRWMTPAEASEFLRLSTKTLHRYHLRGLLPARKTHGRAVRYRQSDLERVFRPGYGSNS